MARDVVILIGPSVYGKNAAGLALSRRTKWPFIEGGAHHTQANKDKQAAGIPLTDANRAAWIDSISQATHAYAAPRIILACSALTSYVQTRLKNELRRNIHWSLLLPTREALQARLEQRKDHFMPASLLDNQLGALTPPPEAVR